MITIKGDYSKITPKDWEVIRRAVKLIYDETGINCSIEGFYIIEGNEHIDDN